MKMSQENQFDMGTNEANIKLNEKFNDHISIPHSLDLNNVNEYNMKIQEAFYENDNQNNAPTYLYNNTPAIKITGDEE
jgi:hypothetical protein